MAAVPNESGFLFEAFWNFSVFQTTFAYPPAQGIVGVGPSFFCAVFFEDFDFNQLVVQVVEIVLHFAVGQFAVDQVAEVVVVIGRAVVGFQAVVRDGRAIVIGQDIVRGVEGKHFVARLGNPAQFVVLELRRTRPLVGAVGQVAGTVVAVAAFDGISRHYFGFAFAAFGQIVKGGDLPFQTT